MRVVVLGGGESGYGSAVLAATKGLEVFLSDMGAIAPKYTDMLDKHGIEYEHGRHTPERILAADVVVKSPGIPETAPIVRRIREAGIPVISEIEFAGRYTAGRTICITGSNGKTTTTTLAGEMLRAGGLDVAVAGNIGDSFAYTVATADKAWYVLELSSFQLDGMYDFRADVAVLTNITPDHLDRYDYSLDKYAASKMRVVQNQLPQDCFIFCGDDPLSVREVSRVRPESRLLEFTTAASPSLRSAGYLDGRGNIVVRLGEQVVEIDAARVKIKGLHNTRNVMAASLAALSAGVDAEAILRTVYSFEGVEHRMEFAGEAGGVQYINDSKATNVDSTWYALESMRRPTVWIAGGTDKGNDYGPLKELAREHVKALVCMGVDNAKLAREFGGVVDDIYDTASMDEAMAVCRRIALPGDVVLLSPACASFDLFRNYEDRGRQFKERVRRIKNNE